jgi:hypothetical protein
LGRSGGNGGRRIDVESLNVIEGRGGIERREKKSEFTTTEKVTIALRGEGNNSSEGWREGRGGDGGRRRIRFGGGWGLEVCGF